MTEERGSTKSAELELEPETITDLEPADEQADEVYGGRCVVNERDAGKQTINPAV